MVSSEQKIFGSTLLFFVVFVTGTSLIDTWTIKNVNVGGFYLYFFSLSLVLFSFGVLVLYRSIVNEYSSLSFLVASILSAALSYFFGFLNWDPSGGRYYETSLYQLQVLFTTLSTLLIYMHYELNRRATPDTTLIALVTFLLTPHSLMNLYYLFTEDYSRELSGINTLSLVLLQIGTIFVFGWITYNGRKVSLSLLKNEKKSVRWLGASQLTGLYLLFLSVLGELIETVTPLDILNTPLFVLSLLLIGIPYYIDPKIFLFIPINIKAMGIITSDGLTMYYKPIAPEFKSESDKDISSQLFGGLIIALSSMGQEVAKSKQAVDSLNFGDRSIIVEYNDPFYFVIFANNATYFLEREMKEYLKELKEQYPVGNTGTLIPESVFTELNKKFFPILEEEMSSQQ